MKPGCKRGATDITEKARTKQASAKKFSFVHRESPTFSCLHQTSDDAKPAMIQRTLLRQPRLLGPCIRANSRSTFVKAQFRAREPAAPTSRPIAAARWYSTEPEAKKDADGSGSEAGQGAESEAEAVDPVKKELEAKNKEILDLKVCSTLPFVVCNFQY